MDFVLPDVKSLRVLAPFADMLNHSPEVKQCHAYDPLSGSLSVLAGKDCEVGDQVNSPYTLMEPHVCLPETISLGFHLLRIYSK